MQPRNGSPGRTRTVPVNAKPLATPKAADSRRKSLYQRGMEACPEWDERVRREFWHDIARVIDLITRWPK